MARMASTCRLMYHEATLIYYRSNTFGFVESYLQLGTFARMVGTRNRDLISSVLLGDASSTALGSVVAFAGVEELGLWIQAGKEREEEVLYGVTFPWLFGALKKLRRVKVWSTSNYAAVEASRSDVERKQREFMVKALEELTLEVCGMEQEEKLLESGRRLPWGNRH